jgi:hypothetical protein
MATPTVNPLEKTIQGILKLLGKLLRERAHAQLVITVRDGKIQLIDERRSFLPENLPE